jgi:ketopantoate reductase
MIEASVLVVGAGATKASMLQDLERGIETEVDVINGAPAGTCSWSCASSLREG